MVSLWLVSCGEGTLPTPDLNYTPQSPTGDASGEEQPAQPEVVALVNGQSIMYTTFERELMRYEAGRAALGIDVSGEDGYKQQVLDLLIEQELIRQLADSQGIVVTDEMVNAEIQTMIDETNEDYFNGWLVGNYYTLDEFREVVRLDLVTKQLLSPVIDSVPTAAEHVHARHILVNSQAEAEEILTRLQNGEDFAELARQYSVDVTSRDNGGDLGWFPRGGLLVSEVEEAAFSLSAGEISGVIASPFGYHIVQNLETSVERDIDFETRQRLIERTIEDWRLGLRDGADIQQVIVFS